MSRSNHASEAEPVNPHPCTDLSEVCSGTMGMMHSHDNFEIDQTVGSLFEMMMGITPEEWDAPVKHMDETADE